MIRMQQEFFDQLEPGIFEIHAPTVDNVVQVDGLSLFNDSTLLTITAEPSQVSIARADGAGLMVQVAKHDIGRGQPEQRQHVFASPISRLVLCQDPEEYWQIQPADGLVIVHEAAAIEFLNTLCTYAGIKKRRERARADTLATATTED